MRDGRGKTVGPEISAADMTDMKSGGLLCPATQGDQITDKSKPAPLETDPGQQKDDNIDDLGRKQDGSKHEQPGKPNLQSPRWQLPARSN